MKRINTETAPSHIIRLAEQLHRLNVLNKYGFCEQNHIADYTKKLSDNKFMQTHLKVKALSVSAKLFRSLTKQCEGVV
jgi:hypothetical protein